MLPSPYETPLMEAHLYFIMFDVNVPVLSENIYYTYPNSSFRLDDSTVVNVLFLGSSKSMVYVAGSAEIDFP